MPQERAGYPVDKRAAKRAAVLGAREPKRASRALLLAVAVALAAAGAYLLSPREAPAPPAGALFHFAPEGAEAAPGQLEATPGRGGPGE